MHLACPGMTTALEWRVPTPLVLRRPSRAQRDLNTTGPRRACLQSGGTRGGRTGGPIMKRRNVQMAFVGEGMPNSDAGPEKLVEGDEAVDIEVKGGKLMLVAPATTPDAELFDKATMLGGELILENGLRLSF